MSCHAEPEQFRRHTLVGSAEHDASLYLDPLIDGVQAARVFGGVHPKSVAKWARAGKFRSYLIGARRFYRVSDLDRYIQSCSTGPSQSARLEAA